MDNFYETRNSIYCYENSNVLVNKLNIKNKKELNKKEAAISAVKIFNLRQNNMIGDFSINHLISIHKYIFEDIYPFAGLFRTENIAKGEFRFADWIYIEDELKKLLENLKKENFLANLSKEDLANRLAYYMSELNVLHPFREGNGRTIREFIRQLAFKNNYILDLRKVETKDLLVASIKSVVNSDSLEQIIYKCLSFSGN